MSCGQLPCMLCRTSKFSAIGLLPQRLASAVVMLCCVSEGPESSRTDFARQTPVQVLHRPGVVRQRCAHPGLLLGRVHQPDPPDPGHADDGRQDGDQGFRLADADATEAPGGVHIITHCGIPCTSCCAAMSAQLQNLSVQRRNASGAIHVMQEPPLATEFLEVPCEVKTAEIEKIGGVLLQYQ